MKKHQFWLSPTLSIDEIALDLSFTLGNHLNELDVLDLQLSKSSRFTILSNFSPVRLFFSSRRAFILLFDTFYTLMTEAEVLDLA